MIPFLAEWGLEILFSVISALVLGFFTYQATQLREKKSQYRELIKEQEAQKAEIALDTKLEPIYQELEELRTYVRETQNIEKTHMALIVASYRFRLIQLCKQYIHQEYMTTGQYEQLTEFYKLYVGLGGNGQAQSYYERAIALPIHDEEEK